MINELESVDSMMSLDAPLRTSVMPRWQRKQLQDSSSVCISGDQRDRLIPNRSAMCMDTSNYVLSKENGNPDVQAATGGMGGADGGHSGDFNKVMECNLLPSNKGPSATHKVLSFCNKAPAPSAGHQNSLKVLYSQNKVKGAMKSAQPMRHIPSAPIRVLDAPEILDDYYLNLLSWGANNVLAVALGQSVYLWNAATGDITELLTLDGEDYVSSISWITEGSSHIAVGTGSGQTQLWDANEIKYVRGMNGHSARVGALAWNSNILTSGSRDTTAVHHDVRIARHAVATLRSHTQEVCGLAWSPDGSMLASGSNDNTLCLWDASVPQGRFSSAPRHVLTEHQAAVKALAWCPFERNTLASGGGTADRCIKFWNAQTGAMLNSVDTGSQVCSLLWSTTEREILSSHGYAENQLCLWKYPTMAKTKELMGHTSRVLHMAASPDGQTVVSAAGDETLRFWNVFAPPSKSKASGGSGGVGSPSHKFSPRIR
ncbi:unnamed protein product [Discosporangium mesarthrocarpum]